MAFLSGGAPLEAGVVAVFVLFCISYIFPLISSSRSLSNLKVDGLEFAKLRGLPFVKLMLREMLHVD